MQWKHTRVSYSTSSFLYTCLNYKEMIYANHLLLSMNIFSLVRNTFFRLQLKNEFVLEMILEVVLEFS